MVAGTMFTVMQQYWTFFNIVVVSNAQCANEF